MYYKLRLKLLRLRKFARVRGRKLWHKLNGRQRTWRVYYETDSKRVVAVCSIWPWLKPHGLSYAAFKHEPSRKQARAAAGLPGHEMPLAEAIEQHNRAAWVATYAREDRA